MSVHVSPCFENVKEGDIVTVGPVSYTHLTLPTKA